MILPLEYGTSIETIVLGIIANGLTSVISNLGHRGRDILVGRKINEKQTALQPIFDKVIKNINEMIKSDKDLNIDNISSFLESSEVETIIRQIYSTKLLVSSTENDSVDNEDGYDLDIIYKEFIAIFVLFTGTDESKFAPYGKDLFYNLIEGCELALAIAIDEGILSAHEAKSSLRHYVLMNELAAIEKTLDFFALQGKPILQDIMQFEKKYRQQICNRHGSIIPPNLDKPIRIPIDKIFVSPDFVEISVSDYSHRSPLNMQDFLKIIHRTVILGTPGGGKSTFASKVCSDLAGNFSGRLIARRLLTPILVVLRDYGSEKKDHNCSILQFIELIANSNYQVKPPFNAVEYMLLNGKAVVIFDGLDELLDTSHRQEISRDIESFCSLYPSVPVLVTSREIGYDQSPLDEKQFRVFRLSPFNESQIREYVINWFAYKAEMKPSHEIQRAEAFLEESKSVSDLRSNPLMLALLCNIYRGENYIPRNRPDVYEKCSMMLFERWDRGRKITPQVVQEIGDQIMYSMMYLAYWIYSNAELQGGVTENRLITKAAEYLNMRRFENLDEAEFAARKLIEFCRGRAWVFTDTGTTREGERLYQFTHRTFLEYFAARYLSRVNSTAQELVDVLLPKISKKEWDVIAQLAFQIQNKTVERAADDLLNALIVYASSTGTEKWNCLSFTARCLKFIIPSQKTVRNITSSYISSWIAWRLTQTRENRIPKKAVESSPDDIFEELLDSAIENQAAITNILKDQLVDIIINGNESDASLILETFLQFKYIYTYSLVPQKMLKTINLFNTLYVEAINAGSDRIKTLCAKYGNLCIAASWCGIISFDTLIEMHGIECIFIDFNYPMLIEPQASSYARKLIDALINSPYYEKQKKFLQTNVYSLKRIGIIVLNSTTLWLPTEKRNELYLAANSAYNTKISFSETEAFPEEFIQDGDCLFGGFVLFAMALETTEGFRILEGKQECAFIRLMHAILFSRYRHEDSREIEKEMSQCNFTSEQRSFILHWTNREINLIQ